MLEGVGDEEVDVLLGGEGVISERWTDGVCDHGLEFLFFLNFVSIISN